MGLRGNWPLVDVNHEKVICQQRNVIFINADEHANVKSAGFVENDAENRKNWSATWAKQIHEYILSAFQVF